jgi:ubiquitin-protein ligase
MKNNMKNKMKSFTFASKDPEYVRMYNKQYYLTHTKKANLKRDINLLAMTFSGVDLADFYEDNVYDFGLHVLQTYPEYEPSLIKLVKLVERNGNKPGIFLNFITKTKLFHAVSTIF